MVGRDGRNLLRVKKRCVDSLSSAAPPRAKYLLLLIVPRTIEYTDVDTGLWMDSKTGKREPVESSRETMARRDREGRKSQARSQVYRVEVMK